MAVDRSTPPPITDFKEIRLDVPAPITLSNGIKMWVTGNGEDEINKISLYITGGAFQESRPMQATSCAMSVFNGNRNMTYSQIAEAIDFYGAWRSLQTHDNCTAFALSSLNENFDKTLPILVDSLRFPTFPERYAIDTAADESVPPAGLLGQEGLEAMVELYETGRTMHRCGRLSAASCLAGAVIGAALAVAPCWSGNWAAVSAARVLLYMLAWLIPGFACRALLKK